MATVTTYEAPRTGSRLSICTDCAARLRGAWPKDRTGDEYCRVYHGAHDGRCDTCPQEG